MDLTVDKQTPAKRPRLDEPMAIDADSQASNDAAPQQKMALDLSSPPVTHGLATPILADIKLSEMTYRRCLQDNSQNKLIVVETEYKKEAALIILEKTPFKEEEIKDLFTDANKEMNDCLKRDFVNDIYSNYALQLPAHLNQVKTTIIHPATQQHIEKYQRDEFHIFRETPELYDTVTKKYLEASQFNIDWVYNILEHKKETERIVFEDSDLETGFVMLPDLKWDQNQLSNMYLIAITNKRDIKSLRDLRQEHLPLLKNIRSKGVEAVVKKYGIAESQLRVYLHYQPSYYHIHVHFTAMSFDAPGSRVERAHLLDTVIDNIELCGDYYAKATISFPAKKGTPLHKAFEGNAA